jgi:hypothetical protein
MLEVIIDYVLHLKGNRGNILEYQNRLFVNITTICHYISKIYIFKFTHRSNVLIWLSVAALHPYFASGETGLAPLGLGP